MIREYDMRMGKIRWYTWFLYDIIVNKCKFYHATVPLWHTVNKFILKWKSFAQQNLIMTRNTFVHHRTK